MSLLMYASSLLRAKIESSTLRMTYMKVCFINTLRFTKELSVISPVILYWQKVKKWPDFYRATGNSKGSSKFLSSCSWLSAPRAVCSGPLLAASSLVADGTEGKAHLSPTVCHLLPFTFPPLESPSYTEATHRAHPAVAALGTPRGQWQTERLQAVPPCYEASPWHFSPEDWSPQHWNTTKTCHELSGNK